MPTYNRQDCIWLPLESLLDQTHDDWELFIIDDGSDEPYDDYLEMLLEEKYNWHESGETNIEDAVFDYYKIGFKKEILLYRSKHFGHPSPVRNLALNWIEGDLICFRDDDGYWDPKYLELMSKPFEDPAVIMTYCNRNISHFPSLYLFNPQKAISHGANYRLKYNGKGKFEHGADTGDIMVRTDIFKQVGGFDSPEQTGGQEDKVLWQKIGGQFPDGKVIHVDQVLNYYIWHNSKFPNRTTPKEGNNG